MSEEGFQGPPVSVCSPCGRRTVHFFLSCLGDSFPLVGTRRPALCSRLGAQRRQKQPTSVIGFVFHKPEPLGFSEHRYSILPRSKGGKEASSPRKEMAPGWGQVGGEYRTLWSVRPCQRARQPVRVQEEMAALQASVLCTQPQKVAEGCPLGGPRE